MSERRTRWRDDGLDYRQRIPTERWVGWKCKCSFCGEWYPGEEVEWLALYGKFICDPCVVIRSGPPKTEQE